MQSMEREKPREPKANATSFKKGRAKTGGRKPGTHNATPKLLKEAILMAAELEGRDGEGKDGLVGMLRRIANEDIRSFAILLGRVLPLQQIETRSDVKVEVAYRSVAEVRRDLEDRGISIELISEIMHKPLEQIEHDDARSN